VLPALVGILDAMEAESVTDGLWGSRSRPEAVACGPTGSLRPRLSANTEFWNPAGARGAADCNSKIEHFTIAAREVTWIWISSVGGDVLRAAVGLRLGSRERNGMNGRW
jgi:hypothetical protein